MTDTSAVHGIRVAAPAIPAAPLTTAAPQFSLELIEGEAARAFLTSRDTLAAWDRLARRCPWATAFQGSDFVSTWFDVYDGAFTLLLVAGFTAGGELVGLLPLAIDARTHDVVVAGTHHAEYQGWLADERCGDAFAAAAFEALRARFPASRVVLRYLAPGAPTAWTQTAAWQRRCVAEPMSRALVDVAQAVASESMKKASNKSRLKRLRREGEVRFDRVTTPAEFSRLLDETIPVYDLRQGAQSGVLPFGHDVEKRAFHEALFAKGLLHVTELRCGDRLVAAHIGVIDGGRVSLGVFAHSPFFSAHSPGKLLLHMLFEMLGEEGFATFDMTPGPGWKDRFATRTDEVVTLTVHFRASGASARRSRLAAERTAKRLALAAGTTPDAVRAKIAKVRGLGVGGIVRSVAQRIGRARKWLGEDVEYCIYSMESERAAKAQPQTPFAVNRIADLLLFQPMEPWQTKQGFYAESMERLAKGDHVYTYVENGLLLCYGWLVPRQERSFVSEVKQEILLPAGSAVAYDYHTHPLGRGKGLHKAALATALADGASIDGTKKVWTGVLADNGPSRHNCIKMGWDHHSSLWMRTRFGRVIPGDAKRRMCAPLSRTDLAKRAVKRTLYRAAKAAGLFALARRMTKNELRILAYHGFDRGGESDWAPTLHMKPATFARRLDLLRKGGFDVLPLSQALSRLDNGTLPPGAVVLTLDDGSATVLDAAVPALRERKMPATFYATSYYVDRDAPVFRIVLQYALWKSDRARLDLAGLATYASGEIALADDGARESALWEITRFGELHLDEAGRQRLAREFCARLGVNYDAIVAGRVCGLATKDELRALAAEFDVQLHTHRHRLPVDEAATRREIEDNRASLAPVVGRPMMHLCYPSNERHEKHGPWLAALGVQSAVTCDLGLNSKETPKLFLKRFLDGEAASEIEFEAEMYGFAELLRRTAAKTRGLLKRKSQKKA